MSEVTRIIEAASGGDRQRIPIDGLQPSPLGQIRVSPSELRAIKGKDVLHGR